MRVEIKIDFLGEGVDNAVFVRWCASTGEKVAKGDIVCEIETYKTLLQIEAPDSGILSDLRYASGDVLNIPAVLGYIETSD